MVLRRSAAAWGLVLWAAAATADGAELRFEDRPGAPGAGAVAVHGLPAPALARLAALDLSEAGAGVLAVRTVTAGEGLPPILGRWWVAAGALLFEPRIAFRAGLAYRARFDGGAFDRLTGGAAGSTPDLELRFEPSPPPSGPATRVEAVYPSADLLPENLLRLYVWFSAPMRRRGIVDGIRLVDLESGAPVGLPFVEVADGLWDPSGRRLTLFFHPGRLKRGVGPRRALGPPLRSGGRYRLEIDGALRDAAGRPLAAGHAKLFSVGPADRRSPEPASWRLTPPAATAEPLRIEFPEPLDHGLLLRLLEIRDAAGRRVAGEPVVGGGETSWSFHPATPWSPGSYTLRVAAVLEDLAGNTPARLFDEATAGGEPRPRAGRSIDLPFDVAAPR